MKLFFPLQVCFVAIKTLSLIEQLQTEAQVSLHLDLESSKYSEILTNIVVLSFNFPFGCSIIYN